MAETRPIRYFHASVVHFDRDLITPTTTAKRTSQKLNYIQQLDIARGKRLRWPNIVFLYLCVIHRYFQTTGNWTAKPGKIQVELKKILLD